MGEVVGTSGTPFGQLYDVELEDVVMKDVVDGELWLATEAEVRDALQDVARSAAAPPADDRERHRRVRYAAMLERLLAYAVADGPQGSVRYALGQQVAWRADATWRLGVVTGLRRRSNTVAYELNMADERVVVGESELREPAEVPAIGSFALGAQVRFVAEGHEDDTDFDAVVCAITSAGDGPLYDIRFSDGDVFEGLVADDLIAV